ncbi:carboxypeptidase-like regulatory domain-containing protein [Hymenobacter ginsengisoli]|uniref:Carboxypeptidase-like regulatory domain-containing protein n=1 Tax=Hymenobacter ginsengisoli TaxID=1051626 RepID=A0ABP8PUY9_9BACT|nr:MULTISPECIES: TonB-dependent receptor [unclassified Hymenobacter]MBO2033739.1 TonB-dependent receptor [Hymenobacter sp. BT559]
MSPQSLFLCLLLLVAGIFPITGHGQTPPGTVTQTVRGTVLDAAANAPVIGATVVVVGVTPALGVSTDAEGRFRLPGVPLGRLQLRITSVGYEDLVRSEVLVTAGKEVVLDLRLNERLTRLDEVQVTYRRADDIRVTNNEMATVSARPFSPLDANRYAGSLGDPARMAQNFAGVSSANDSRNDLVVRGNSPASLLWRLEGVNIPNPNHFGSLGTTGGPVSLLNNNLLAKSDFLTGAFPAEYANALGSVFDLRLRKGNDEKPEFLGQVGFNGLELGAEGPFSPKSKASYLVNYRYSLFSLLKAVGYQIAGTPNYQDFTAKVDVPVGSRGSFSAWTLGGRSNIAFLGRDVDTTKADVYGDEAHNTRVRYFTGIAAASYEQRFTDRTVGKVTLSASRTTSAFQGDSILFDGARAVRAEIPNNASDYTQDKLSANVALTHKFSARNQVSTGFIVDLLQYRYHDAQTFPTPLVRREASGNTAFAQAYGQWKHRFNDRLTLSAGLSASRFALNGSSAVEPRAGLRYQLTPGSSLSAAYGLHSSLQPLLTYFYQSPQLDGSYGLTNQGLGLTRAQHYVLAYDRQLSENLHLRVEGYYQALFDAPVERTASAYSGLTQGADFGDPNRGNLVGRGTGRNYGVELTLERAFAQGYYFLLTTSLFESKYTGSDGIERNTPFNTHYVANALAGREFRVGHGTNTLTLSLKLATTGGKYTTPLDLAASSQQHIARYRSDQAFSQQQAAYFRADVKIGYKLNRAHLTHEIALDMQNITNHQNVFAQAYNPRTNRLGTACQQGFLPIPFYRLTF